MPSARDNGPGDAGTRGAVPRKVQMMKNIAPRALCAAVLMVGLVGGPVGAQSQIGSHSVDTVSKMRTITIESYSYLVPGHVRAGSKVRVINKDDVGHSVTSVDDTTFSVFVPAGATKHFRAPSQPGQYRFYCTSHGGMAGDLVVK